jgi:hypothetical protein
MVRRFKGSNVHWLIGSCGGFFLFTLVYPVDIIDDSCILGVTYVHFCILVCILHTLYLFDFIGVFILLYIFFFFQIDFAMFKHLKTGGYPWHDPVSL